MKKHIALFPLFILLSCYSKEKRKNEKCCSSIFEISHLFEEETKRQEKFARQIESFDWNDSLNMNSISVLIKESEKIYNKALKIKDSCFKVYDTLSIQYCINNMKDSIKKEYLNHVFFREDKLTLDQNNPETIPSLKPYFQKKKYGGYYIE